MVTNFASNMPPEATSKALNLKSEVRGFAKLSLNKCKMSCGSASLAKEAQQKP